jgi:hypothetical protein
MGPVATARGPDLITNRVLSVEPVATAPDSEVRTEQDDKIRNIMNFFGV